MKSAACHYESTAATQKSSSPFVVAALLASGAAYGSMIPRGAGSNIILIACHPHQTAVEAAQRREDEARQQMQVQLCEFVWVCARETVGRGE